MNKGYISLPLNIQNWEVLLKLSQRIAIQSQFVDDILNETRNSWRNSVSFVLVIPTTWTRK
jgi:hypothetical protein